MYAIIETGGKQYRVSEGESLEVESLEALVGDTVTLSRVLMVEGDKGVQIGTPIVGGAVVKAKVTAHGRGPKIIIFKKKRRKTYRRTKGHRQSFTRLEITEIKAA